MNHIFPFEESKKLLVELFEKGLPEELKEKAEFILNLHLSENNFVMNKMTEKNDEQVQGMIVSGCTQEEVEKSLKFEDANTKNGMFRILVRTHLNRSGINHLTMGVPSKKKTLSPRILNFTDSINVQHDSETDIIPRWLEFAKNNSETLNSEVIYNDVAVKALIALNNKVQKEGTILEIGDNEKISAHTLSKELNVDLGWCRIVLGVITGLKYLRANNWEELYKRSFEKGISYSQIDKLIKDCQKNVCEYGYALAGSFFGDLGSPHFVKDDTHVCDGINALFKGLKSPEERVKVVIESAHNIGVHPQVLDKILYFGGSGSLYLIGVKLKNSEIIKVKFLEGLSKIRL